MTEWLPISTSGHLVIAQKLMGLTVPVAFDVALHAGTFLPVLYLFRKELLDVSKAAFRFNWNRENSRLLAYLVLTTAVTGIIGIAFLGFFESLFASTLAVGIGLLVTAVAVLASRFSKGNRPVGLLNSIVIGIAQALAIAPGVSRSGLTISSAIMLRIDRRTAATYSFLLSIPAILGAQLVEISKLTVEGVDPVVVAAGVLTSAVVGYAAIKLLLRAVISDRFHYFAYYCLAAGLVVILAF